MKRCSSHRLLALRRGEAEGILKVSITPEDDEECIRGLERRYVKGGNACSAQVAEAVADAYKRLLKPAIETEFPAPARSVPMRKPSACLPKTCASCCLLLRWGRSG